jgi:hypothetical protein
MTTKLVAFVTTAASMPSADPGILIQEQYHDEEGYVGTGESVIDRSFTAPWGEDTEAGGRAFDYPAVEAELRKMGYVRVDEWEHAGDQICTTVEEL